MKSTEPKVDVTSDDYTSQLAHAFSYYNMNLDKKDARAYMRTYLKDSDKTGNSAKIFDQVPDSFFVQTFGWLARIKTNGYKLRSDHEDKFSKYVIALLINTQPIEPSVEVVVDKYKPSIQDYRSEEHTSELQSH